MNKKLIAVAVAGLVAAPAVHAETTAYGSIRGLIDITNPAGGASTTNLSDNASRIGLKGSTDLGNGMTVSGRWEFGANADNSDDGIEGTRLGWVGLSGGFGSITAGNQWSTYFNTIGSHISPTYFLGPQFQGPFRTANTIQYSNGFGPVSISADVRADDANDGGGNGYAFGLTVTPMENVTLGVSVDSTEAIDAAPGKSLGFRDSSEQSMSPDAMVYGPETKKAAEKDIWGVAASVGFGPVKVSVGHENVEQGNSETEHTHLYLSVSAADNLSLLAGFGEVDDDTSDPSSMFFGAYYSLGGGMTLLLETNSVESGNDDNTRTLAGMVINF